MNDFDKGNEYDEEMITLVIEALWEEREMGRETQARAVWYSIKARLNRERPKVADRKKEVIEIITNYLDNAVINARAVTSYIPGCVAEALYDRIAPLMAREFPEAEINEILIMFDEGDIGAINTKKKLKRLWEGGEVATRGSKSDKEIYDGKPVKHRFTFDEAKEKLRKNPPCQKCGGNKRVPVPRKSPEQENKYWQECPQCGGTGEERRKGGERREKKATKLIHTNLIHLEGPIYMTDRRTRSDRRKHPEESL